jgi:5-methylcytosine-specific restriction protein B
MENEINETLQGYFEFWCTHYKKLNEGWYNTLTAHLKFIDFLKKNIDNISSIEDFEKFITGNYKNFNINLCKYSKKTIEDFLNTYVYEKDCGVGSIGQGSVWNSDKNNHKEKFNENIKKNFNEFLNLFRLNDKKKLNEKIENLFSEEVLSGSSNKRNYPAAKHRLLRTLLPCDVNAIDSKDKFWSLITKLRDKLGIDLFDNNSEKQLMHSIECRESCKKDDILECCALKQMFYWDLYESLLSLEFDKKNLVYYGAPGTGKTYLAKKNAKKLIDIWKLKVKLNDDLLSKYGLNEKNLIQMVQFHPSFSYEDFIEGIRPDENGTFRKVDGIFKEFCRKVGEIELELWQNKNFREKFENKNFCEIKIKDVKEIDSLKNNEKLKILFDNNLNENLTLDDVIPPAVFIIDEINRAELSKVFGELMFCLEYRGYRGKIRTQYSYLKNNIYFEEDGKDYFIVPHNVYIIGTMNTIDRSVDIFDFAMRRRFKWKRIDVDYEIIKYSFKNYGSELVTKKSNEEIGENLANSLKKLNEKIENESLLGKDYQIGHSYLLTFIECNNLVFSNLENLKEKIWDENLKPLLEEYFKGLGLEIETSNKIEELKNIWIK